MKIVGAEFYITSAELEAGGVSDRAADWNRACTFRNYLHLTELGGWHFKLPGVYLDDYLGSLRKTAELPEADSPFCLDDNGNIYRVQELASQILEILEVA